MFDHISKNWLPRLLFRATLFLAGLLVLVVLSASWLKQLPFGDVFQIFADETVVKRTTLASAFGLAVTALVFFRPRPEPPRPKRLNKNAPPGGIAGA